MTAKHKWCNWCKWFVPRDARLTFAPKQTKSLQASGKTQNLCNTLGEKSDNCNQCENASTQKGNLKMPMKVTPALLPACLQQDSSDLTWRMRKWTQGLKDTAHTPVNINIKDSSTVFGLKQKTWVFHEFRGRVNISNRKKPTSKNLKI